MIDTKALREKILDLAMRGKLVPQDPNDEPASELLKRIKAEKEELIKQKKIKRDKNETEIFRGDDNLHYEKFGDGTVKEVDFENTPTGWSLVRLPTVVKPENGAIKRGPFGSAIKKSMFVPYSDEVYKVYEQGNAIRATHQYGSYYLDKNHYKRLESFSVQPQDIIISCAGTIGKSYLVPQDAPGGVINQALLRLRINENLVNIHFFLLAFQNQVERLNDDAAGTAMKNLGSVQYLKCDLLWLLPPLAEQKKIVNKYFELKDMVDTIEREQNLLQQLSDQLKKKVLDVAMRGKLVPQDPNDEPASVLLEKIRTEKQRLYEDGKLKKKDLEETTIIKGDDNAYYEKLPENWVETNLQRLTTTTTLNDGDWVVSKDMTDKPEIKLVQLGSIDFGKYTDKGFKYIAEQTFEKLNCTEIKPGYLLINRLIAEKMYVTILPVIPGKLITVVDMCWIAPSNYFKQKFMMYQLLSNRIQEFANNLGSGSTRLRISKGNLIKLPIILPPIEEQERIINAIEQDFGIIDSIVQ